MYRYGGITILKGDKVLLREYKKDELYKLLDIVNEDQFKQYVYSGIPYPFMYKDVENDHKDSSGYKDYFDFAIESLDDGSFIGECGIKKNDWKNSKSKIYIYLGSEYVANGYGTEATSLLVDFIFNQMNQNKITLTVFSYNERAIKSYKKLGFKKEAILKQEFFKNGEYYDEILMGLLKREYIGKEK